MSFLHYATCRIKQPKGYCVILVLIWLTQFIPFTLQKKCTLICFILFSHVALLQIYDWKWVSLAFSTWHISERLNSLTDRELVHFLFNTKKVISLFLFSKINLSKFKTCTQFVLFYLSSLCFNVFRLYVSFALYVFFYSLSTIFLSLYTIFGILLYLCSEVDKGWCVCIVLTKICWCLQSAKKSVQSKLNMMLWISCYLACYEYLHPLLPSQYLLT